MKKIEKRQLQTIKYKLRCINSNNEEKFNKEREKPEGERDLRFIGLINENFTEVKECLKLIDEILENDD